MKYSDMTIETPKTFWIIVVDKGVEKFMGVDKKFYNINSFDHTEIEEMMIKEFEIENYESDMKGKFESIEFMPV